MTDFQMQQTEHFSNEDASWTSDLALVLKALGHESRLEIIRQLTLRDRCCGGDFCDCMSLSQSTISQHLDLLKKAGIVIWQQQGTRSIYSLNRDKLIALSKQLRMIAESNECCSQIGLSDDRKKSGAKHK